MTATPRWIEDYELRAEMTQKLLMTRLVYLAHREADIMALMVRKREVVQQVSAQTLQLPDGSGGFVQSTCNVAKEMAPSTGDKPIEWQSLTNLQLKELELAPASLTSPPASDSFRSFRLRGLVFNEIPLRRPAR